VSVFGMCLFTHMHARVFFPFPPTEKVTGGSQCPSFICPWDLVFPVFLKLVKEGVVRTQEGTERIQQTLKMEDQADTYMSTHVHTHSSSSIMPVKMPYMSSANLICLQLTLHAVLSCQCTKLKTRNKNGLKNHFFLPHFSTEHQFYCCLFWQLLCKEWLI
jgi:hypothetical protein